MKSRGVLWLGFLGATSLLYAACGGDEDSAGAAAAAGARPDGGAAGASAGAGSGAGGAPVSATALPCAVETVLRQRCLQCHDAERQFGAPLSLATREQLLGPSFSNARVSAAAGAIARMTDGGSPMPPAPYPRATAAEVATLRDWLAAGGPAAKAGEACVGPGGAGGSGSGGGSGGTGGGGVVVPINCEPDIMLAASVPYEMPQAEADQYVCFSFDLPAGPKRHITAATPAIDNSKILHHLIAFQVPAGEGPGPEPTPCSGVFPAGWKMIFGWGPGGLPLELPPEAGFPTESNAPTRFVVQAHYSNLTHEAGQRDRTGIGLCSTEQLRPNDADVVAFGGVLFSIDAGRRVTLDCSLTLTAGTPATKAFRAWPHMHKLGESFAGQVRHPDQTFQSLGNVLDYDFEHQLSYPIDATIGAGDTVASSCTWNNRGGGPVSFGDNTSSEMCFNFISYYPRITVGAALDPAFSASCTKRVE